MFKYLDLTDYLTCPLLGGSLLKSPSGKVTLLKSKRLSGGRYGEGHRDTEALLVAQGVKVNVFIS
jgi:hypothetical protein